MPSPRHTAFGALVVLLTVAPAIMAGHGRIQSQAGDAAAGTFQRICSNCHPITRVTAMRRSRAQWQEVIETMISARGAKVTDEEFDTILGYLAREHGRVNINTAPAEEIVETVGLTADKADAIVSYRRDHGKFEDFDALLKVPGIDRETLERKREAITF